MHSSLLRMPNALLLAPAGQYPKAQGRRGTTFHLRPGVEPMLPILARTPSVWKRGERHSTPAMDGRSTPRSRTGFRRDPTSGPRGLVRDKQADLDRCDGGDIPSIAGVECRSQLFQTDG